MSRSRALSLGIAVFAGFLALLALLAAQAVVAGYVEPGSRIAAFLAGQPRHLHPVRLAAAEWFVVLAMGLAIGAAVTWLARARRLPAGWLLLATAAGYLFALALVASGHGLTVGVLARALAPLGIAAACAYAWLTLRGQTSAA